MVLGYQSNYNLNGCTLMGIYHPWTLPVASYLCKSQHTDYFITFADVLFHHVNVLTFKYILGFISIRTEPNHLSHPQIFPKTIAFTMKILKFTISQFTFLINVSQREQITSQWCVIPSAIWITLVTTYFFKSFAAFSGHDFHHLFWIWQTSWSSSQLVFWVGLLKFSIKNLQNGVPRWLRWLGICLLLKS